MMYGEMPSAILEEFPPLPALPNLSLPPNLIPRDSQQFQKSHQDNYLDEEISESDDGTIFSHGIQQKNVRSWDEGYTCSPFVSESKMFKHLLSIDF